MRAHRVMPHGAWDPAREIDSVTLDFDHRHRRRIALATDRGASLLLDLADATHLHDGDGLETEGGDIVRVCAKAEALIEITAADAIGLARIAYHLGNRHLPLQIHHGALRIRRDHVIAAMAETLGGTVRPLDAAFDPEPGAYASGGHHHAHEH